MRIVYHKLASGLTVLFVVNLLISLSLIAHYAAMMPHNADERDRG
jgi:hypothetical protein